MARERPIKLHVKDGKDTTFRLIGPKGRVLNSLKWDGESLMLSDVSSDDVPVESENMENAVEESDGYDANGDEQPKGDENLQNILGDEQPASPADAPDTTNETGSEVGTPEGVDDVSGESEAPMTDDELAELLDSDNQGQPDIEESDETPDETDNSEPEAVEEKKPKD
jgi:hypothetical protein